MAITLTILSSLALAAAVYTISKRPAKALVPVRVDTHERQRPVDRY